MDDLDLARIKAGAQRWTVEVFEMLESTQSKLAFEGGPDRRLVVARHQTAGRGRAGRQWLADPGSCLTFSVLLRDCPAALQTLRASVAVSRAIETCTQARTTLKWPNDVLLERQKVAGILGEAFGDFIVLGIGVNVHNPPPFDGAATLEGKCRRDELMVAILSELDSLPQSWMDEYRQRCDTIGKRVTTPVAEGLVTEVTDDGALVVDGFPVYAGDVT